MEHQKLQIYGTEKYEDTTYCKDVDEDVPIIWDTWWYLDHVDVLFTFGITLTGPAQFFLANESRNELQNLKMYLNVCCTILEHVDQTSEHQQRCC